jgi:peptidoglycan/LPS O-acetylase OafA/YrhL
METAERFGMRTQSETGFNGHFRILDSYRFIAASMVCLYHFNKADILGFSKYTFLVENLRLGVDFFFVLSGFVIAKTYLNKIEDTSGFGRFMWKRFARLYPLHFLTLLVGIVGGLLVGSRGLQAGTNPEIFSITAILANLTLTHSLGVTQYGSFNLPSWSISAEMFVYLLFPLFALLATRLSLAFNAGLIVVYILIAIVVRQYLGLSAWTIAWYDGGAFRAVPTFFAGVLIAQILSTQLKNFAPSIWFAHIAFLLAGVVMHLHIRDELVLMCFIMVVFLAAASEQNGAKSQLQKPSFVHLGNASFSLYMWHMPIKVGFFAIIGKLFGTSLAPMWGAAVLSYIVSVIVALLCYKYFEIPCRNAILSYKPNSKTDSKNNNRIMPAE